MGFRSELWEGQSNFWTPILTKCDFSNPDALMGLLCCWKRNGYFPKYCHRIGRAALFRMSTYILWFHVLNHKVKGTLTNAWKKNPHTIAPLKFIIGLLQSFKHSSGIRQIRTNSSDCQIKNEIHHSKTHFFTCPQSRDGTWIQSCKRLPNHKIPWFLTLEEQYCCWH